MDETSTPGAAQSGADDGRSKRGQRQRCDLHFPTCRPESGLTTARGHAEMREGCCGACASLTKHGTVARS